MSVKYRRGLLCVGVAVALLTTGAYADDLLIVDLTVTDEVTITATDGLSAVTASGSNFTGFYFENFYGGSGGPLSGALVFGDLTTAENPSDGSPSIFRGGSGTDPGLNVWSFSTDGTVTFTAGSLAFVGSATWGLDPEEYADMLAGSTSGNLYFPADTEDDIAGADLLGTYTVIPEPATLSLLGLGLALGLRRRR